MKNRSLLLVLALMLPTAVSAQTWVETGGFPDDETWTTYIHGLAVDAEDKVWVGPWPTSVWVTASGDTVKDANGEALRTRSIHVYNPDGTEAFHPIRTITVNGETDTLLSGTNIRGLRRDHNGDILLVLGGSSMMYRISHVTGEGMDKVFLNIGSPTAPGVDMNGNIFIAPVVPGAHPIKIYSADFADTGVIAADTSRGFSRAFEVSADGNSVYWVGYSNRHILKYARADEFSEFNYASPDTLHWGLISESNHRNPATGNIWFGHSSAAGVEWADNAGLGYGFGREDQLLTWYGLDVTTDAIVDSLQVSLIHPWNQQKTRAIAFSSDGMTAYVALWETNPATPLSPLEIAVKKFVQGPTSIERDPVGVPEQFTLGQNYPNPFNPQTQIQFDLKEAGAARMAVYDVLGREVRVLVDEYMQAGHYTVTFTDTGDLPSGVYLYRLMVNGQSLSSKMILSK